MDFPTLKLTHPSSRWDAVLKTSQDKLKDKQIAARGEQVAWEAIWASVNNKASLVAIRWA